MNYIEALSDLLYEVARKLLQYRLTILAAVILTATTTSALTVWPERTKTNAEHASATERTKTAALNNKAPAEKAKAPETSLAVVREGFPVFTPVRASEALANYAAERAALDASRRKSRRYESYTLPERIQFELRRLGCYTGPIDGRWNRRTRAAVAQLLINTNARLPTTRPDTALLSLAKQGKTDTCGQKSIGTNIETAALPATTSTTMTDAAPNQLYGVPSQTVVAAVLAASAARSEGTSTSSFAAYRGSDDGEVTQSVTSEKASPRSYEKRKYKKKSRKAYKKKRYRKKARYYKKKRSRKYRKRRKSKSFARSMNREMRKLSRTLSRMF